MATGEEYQAPIKEAEDTALENPPPYSPATGQYWQQQPHPAQHVHQFMQQNPYGFVQQQNPPQMSYTSQSPGGFSNLSTGYGYNQPMSPSATMSSSTTVVVNQPQATNLLVVNPVPYSYIVPAILACFFCCWLVGIGAIIAAVMSQSQAAEMHYEEARKSATVAKILTWISFGCGLCVYIIIIVITTTAK